MKKKDKFAHSLKREDTPDVIGSDITSKEDIWNSTMKSVESATSSPYLKFKKQEPYKPVIRAETAPVPPKSEARDALTGSGGVPRSFTDTVAPNSSIRDRVGLKKTTASRNLNPQNILQDKVNKGRD